MEELICLRHNLIVWLGCCGVGSFLLQLPYQVCSLGSLFSAFLKIRSAVIPSAALFA